MTDDSTPRDHRQRLRLEYFLGAIASGSILIVYAYMGAEIATLYGVTILAWELIGS